MLMVFIGIKVNIPGLGQKVVKVRLIAAVLDLPAKASMLNCVQFNGTYGCCSCKHPGVSVSKIRRNCNYICIRI